MQVKTATAVRFHQVFRSGRSRPCLIVAVDESGSQHEVVIKPSAGNERGTAASATELFCNLFATELGLRSPIPYLIEIPSGFDQLIPEKDADVRPYFADGSGRQFACRYEVDHTEVAPQRTILKEKLSEAGMVFAFDALIQNADRRVGKPNLLENSDGYLLIDHDLALTFLGGMLIGGVPKPWALDQVGGPSFAFLRNHILYGPLSGKQADLSQFQTRLKNFNGELLEEIFQKIPAGWWSHDQREELRDYVLEGVSNAENLIQCCLRVLQP